MTEQQAPYTPDAPPAPLAAANGVADPAEAVHFAPLPGARPSAMPPPPRPAPPNQGWYEVEPTELPGYWVRLWLDYPGSIAAVIDGASSTETQKRQALGKVILEHNQWPHPERPDEVLAQPQEAAFWDDISGRVVFLIVQRLRAEVWALPKSLSGASRRG